MRTFAHRGARWCAGTILALLPAFADAQTPTPLNDVKPFQALGTINPATVAVNVMCANGSPGTRMSGALKGNEIGAGTYTLCIDAVAGPHQAWSAGTLTFTRDDNVSAFTLRLAIMRLSNYQATATYLGTYDLDPVATPTGTFSRSLANVSGLLEWSQPSRLLFLNGVLKSP